ncbi:MAG: hypothetical protein KJZ90_00535 [Rhodocyclaceae bacterium]|nr:hypothetical protein [Rhodocyclaceae bacterium]
MSNDVIEKLDAIEKKISQQLAELIAAARLKEAPEIWGTADIAAWLDISEVTVKMRVINRPGFPKPIDATGAQEGKKRYFAKEVINWAEKNRID